MRICVFCGSSSGAHEIYKETAHELGSLLAKQGHTLVYGGGNIGLMGILADAVLSAKGEVIGVIPDFLMQKEVGHQGLNQLEIVKTMHDRKKRMAELSDAFIAMPGGWGTLDELAEILTWRQLGLIHQPICLINVNHYFDALLDQMKIMTREGFLKSDNLALVNVANTPSGALSRVIQ